jgi:hypothetical protein
MNWDKINIKSIIVILRELEKNSLTLDGEYSIIYSDGKEELKISYKNLKK